jgi:hypothetical protein
VRAPLGDNRPASWESALAAQFREAEAARLEQERLARLVEIRRVEADA